MQSEILELLNKQEGLTVKYISEVLKTNREATNRQVNRLHKYGFVTVAIGKAKTQYLFKDGSKFALNYNKKRCGRVGCNKRIMKNYIQKVSKICPECEKKLMEGLKWK